MAFLRQPSGLDALLQRRRPNKWQEFWAGPCKFIARYIYAHRDITHETSTDPATIICISDTHDSQTQLPPGDILIHAGDLTQSGSLKELQATISWLSSQPHPHKIVVAGNHDILLDKACDRSDREAVERAELDWGDCLYLENEATTITCANGRRLKIYGSPLSPRHGNWAFQYPRPQDVWSDTIPADTDILVTHGPPLGHLDLLRLGCHHLLRELWRVRPLLHVFGHVHEGHGHERIPFDGLQEAFERTVAAGGGILNMIAVAAEEMHEMESFDEH
ncbi:rhamnogalacturonate lyase C [Fusarium albosuccineum]|uniref:Rhamnogalacturonate lyase C n=1 Tax=Fusarium albosuccineum TaxID=1237068 RepID=A0A8H4L3G5_9HYPO|nr:rhamnogalacturonate lyase C [Fusarium albosuccineum]